MREIKFRAWIKSLSVMADVLAIDFENERVLLKGYKRDTWATFNQVTFMQYTGLEDKNGVEVYFDDIVEDDYRHRYEVVFEGDCLRCNGIRSKRNGYRPKNRWFSRDLEVIGNIHKNPELLEGDINAIKQ